MEYIDYYNILGIHSSANESEIKSAYRKLARKYHPDLNPNDIEAKKKFQEINEANEVLSDPEKRKKYDKFGKDWKHAEEFEKANQQNQQKRQQSQHRGFHFEDQDGNDFSDFFSSMFGGQSNRQSNTAKFKGQDYTTEIHLSLFDAYSTHQQMLNINGNKVRITIPAGVENGQVIKLKGHGAPGVNGGPNGDLYITFIIAPHPKLKRIGNDIHTTIEIDLYTAVLGGEVMLDTFSGKVKLKVSPETQNLTKIRLKGKGFPMYKQEGQFGDLYVTYTVKIPTHLTEKQKDLFRQLSQL